MAVDPLPYTGPPYRPNPADNSFACGCRVIKVERIIAVAIPCTTHAGKMEFFMYERGVMKLVPVGDA